MVAATCEAGPTAGVTFAVTLAGGLIGAELNGPIAAAPFALPVSWPVGWLCAESGSSASLDDEFALLSLIVLSAVDRSLVILPTAHGGRF